MIQESQLLSIIDHTLLKAEASREDIIRLCQEAIHYGVATIFTHGYYTPLVAEQLAGSRVRVGATAGFPYGAQPPAVKAFEARTSIADGAQEIDIVLNIGAMKSGEFDVVYRDVCGVREACADRAILKVILETCLLTREEKIRACEICVKAGADFVKTSTGLSYGGATLEDVRLMREVVGDCAKVKAAGGIRTLAQAMAMVEAGADRIGTSSMLTIARELEAKAHA